MDLNLSELNKLDINNIGSWPSLFKGLLICIVCALVLAAGYYYDTQEQQSLLEKARSKEGELKKTFEAKQAKAVNLEIYKSQMNEMEESFGTMLRQLPSQTEVAELLVDITQTGLASGLSFTLFKPQSEIPKEFYAELPIVLKVKGGYHQFGAFVSGVAALPRIVTLHDITITRTREKGDLNLEATAKTYRYLEEEEIMALESSRKPKGRGIRRR